MTKNNTSEAALKADLQEDEETAPLLTDTAAKVAASANAVAEWEALQVELDKKKAVALSAIDSLTADLRATRDRMLNKKPVTPAKDGEESRAPSKLVFEEFFRDSSKLDEQKRIRVRDWKQELRKSVVEFAKGDTDYVVINNKSHKYIALAPKGTGDEASAPQSTVEANPPAVTKEAAQSTPTEANAPVVPEKAVQPTTVEAKTAVPTQEAA